MSSTFAIQQSSHSLTGLPSGTILLHSTNCFANWGAGFALALHEAYPLADRVYAAHCDAQRPTPDTWPSRDKLVGTCLLIPPQLRDGQPEGRGVWIACLFTSYGYGRPTKNKAGKDSQTKIVKQTRDALVALRDQLEILGSGKWKVEDAPRDMGMMRIVNFGDASNRNSAGGKDEMQPLKEVYSPRFNSGSFGVKWETTQEMVEQVFDGWDGKWSLLAPAK